MEETIRERQRCRKFLILRHDFPCLFCYPFVFFSLSMDEIDGMGCACAWYLAKFSGQKWSVNIKKYALLCVSSNNDGRQLR